MPTATNVNNKVDLELFRDTTQLGRVPKASQNLTFSAGGPASRSTIPSGCLSRLQQWLTLYLLFNEASDTMCERKHIGALVSCCPLHQLYMLYISGLILYNIER